MVIAWYLFFLNFSLLGWASLSPAVLDDNLLKVKDEVTALEQSLVKQLKLNKIQKLLKLRKIQKKLTHSQCFNLEKKLDELKLKQNSFEKALRVRREKAQKYFHLLRLFELMPQGSLEVEATRSVFLQSFGAQSEKEVHELSLQILERGSLMESVQEAQDELTYFSQDLAEQEGVFQLSQKLELDFIEKTYEQRLIQLKQYRHFKDAEFQVEKILRTSIHSVKNTTSDFLQKKGKLSLPVKEGRLLSDFGPVYDPPSGLYLFRKGVSIGVASNQPVKAIANGKVIFSGELPLYGKAIIIDHGRSYYSVCAHLGLVLKRPGDFIQSGEVVGLTVDSQSSLYFEMWSRNIAVNPLQWFAN